MITFLCPSCQQSYKVSDRQAGQKFACGECGQRVQVPLPTADASTQTTGRTNEASQFLYSKAIIAGCLVLIVGGGALFLFTFIDTQEQPSKKTTPNTSISVNGPPVKTTPNTKEPQKVELPGDGATEVAKKEVAKKVHSLFKTYCYRCHGENGAAEGGLNFILDLEKLATRKLGLAGNPEKSRLYRRVHKEEMPPEDESLRPGPAEVALLKRWIEDGAPTPGVTVSPAVYTTTASMIKQIHASQQELPPRDRRFARFFTLTHLANAGLRQDELQTYRVALAKLVNSLSWNKEIVAPKAVDPSQTIFRIDIRDYQWGEKSWKGILQHYPYGILWDHPQAKETVELAGGDLHGGRVKFHQAYEHRRGFPRENRCLAMLPCVFGPYFLCWDVASIN